MGVVVGGGEGGHGPDGIDLLGRAQGRSPAEGVAEQELRCLVLGGQPRGGGEEFLDVGGEAELGEVETQARDAVGRECLAHPGDRGNLARTGETVREDRVRDGRGVGQVDGSGQFHATRRGECHAH